MRKPIHLPNGEGLRPFFCIALCLSLSHIAAQQCPRIVNCPQSTSTYCDFSPNDPLLWNEPPFTFGPSLGHADSHEGAIDLNIKAIGCDGGGVTHISFTLYLDLDNDDWQETVIMGNAPPPAGRVLANNSFNPGYAGGDTLRFDERSLPDSMLYRFAFEKSYSGDTTIGWVRFNTDSAPFDFVPVILPEGRHRIEWRVVQDSIVRYCDRNFKVKDCQKPVVACKPLISVYLDVTQTVTLPLLHSLESVSDNITPDSQLVLGMRRVGTGVGFPLDGQGNPQDTVMFNCATNEDQFVEIWVKDRVGNLEFCTAPVLVYDTVGYCPFTPFSSICARTYWNDELIRGVSFDMTWNYPNQPPVTNHLYVYPGGCAELSALPPSSYFTLSAAKDTFPLNGVTTYDLVLISKHILATEPFDAGWKIAAADVNHSNTVTTFDIVELRKLILGLNAQLPNGTPSWRFFVDTCTAWGSPFFAFCPSTYGLPVLPIGAYPPQLSFSGLKMGDVNGTALSIDTLQGAAQTRGNAVLLEMPDIEMTAGETLEIPLRVSKGGKWEGFQFSLKFDPDIIEVETVEPRFSIPLTAEHWAKPQAGLLNLSWSDPVPSVVLPGDELLRLRVNARSDAKLSEVFQLPANTRVVPEAYDATGLTFPLQLAFSNKEHLAGSGANQWIQPMPNPTTGSARLPLRLQIPETVSLEISDLAGKTLWRNEVSLEAGAHFIEIPALSMPHSGMYVWRVLAENLTQSGRIVRL